MNKLIWSIAILFFPYVVLTQSDVDLNELVKNNLREEKLIGVSYSIIDNGTISTGAVGLKNASTQEELDANDKIHIGSITKSLIATGILRLVTLGKLSLDAPIEQLVPEIAFDNPWSTNHEVTVKTLLNHTSGLQDAELWQVFSEEAESNTPLIEVFTRDQDVLKIRTKPGSRFSYSNMGYTLLGIVIEKVTNEPYETYLDKNLLFHLGMKNSSFQFISQDTDPDLAMGHYDGGITQKSRPMYLRPSGQFTTTAYDMALLASFLMSDGKLDGHIFIDPMLLKEMGKPSTTEANQNGLKSGYQFGLSYRDRYGVIGYYHAGNVIGYVATLYLFPDEKKAFFISFNTDSETANYQVFNEIFSGYLNINRPQPLTSDSSNAVNLESFAGYYKLSPIRFELFAYLDLLFNSISIKTDKENKKLLVSSPQQESYSLFPLENNLFRKEDRVRGSHIFYKQNGRLVFTDGLATYEKKDLSYFLFYLLNLALGIIGLVMIILRGIYIMFSKKYQFSKQGLFVPFFSIILLFIPIPFFFLSSFTQIGDLTVGNLLLTISTAILPIALLFGILMILLNRNGSWKLDLFAAILFLQWIVLLTYWGLIPLKLWEV